MRDYIVSGVPLRDPAGIFSVDYTRSKLAGDGSRAVLADSDFGTHGGQRDMANYFGSSKETLVINIDAADKDEFALTLRALDGLFGRRDFEVVTAPQRTPLTLPNARSGQSFSVPDPTVLRTTRMRRFGSRDVERIGEAAGRISYVLDNIYGGYRSVSTYTSGNLPLTALSNAWDLSTLTVDSNAPITVGSVTIRGPLSANGYVRVFDQGSDHMVGITLDGSTSLTATRYVTIDFETHKALMYAFAGDPLPIDVSGFLDVSGEGGFELEAVDDMSRFPVGSTYAATVRANGYGAGTNISMALKRSFLA